MRAGKLRHRVTIQQETQTEPGDGTVSREWTPLETVWASVEPLRGRELIEAQQLSGRISHRIRLRGYDGLTRKHRISFDGRTFGIEAVLSRDERGIEQELMCIEDV